MKKIKIKIAEELKSMIINGEDISKVDYSEIEDMSYLFVGQNIVELPAIDFSNVKNTEKMFALCKNLKKIDNLNMPNAVNATNMFEGCAALGKVGTIDMPEAINIANMFKDCEALRVVNKINSPKAKDIESIFCNCYNIKSIRYFDTSSVTNMRDVFDRCFSMPSRPLEWDFSKVKNIDYFTDDIEKVIEMIGPENIIDILKRKKEINEFEIKALTQSMNEKEKLDFLKKQVKKCTSGKW